MQTKNEYPNWFLWLCENWIGLFFLFATITLVTIAVLVYVENRFTSIEDRLKSIPPRSYQAPDLSQYPAPDFDSAKYSSRGSMYVPSYSHIYYHGGSPLQLESTLSIRNIDTDQPIYLETVSYYDTDGELVKSYLDQRIKLKPLQTIDFLVEERDSTGGSGANFIVNWNAEDSADQPVMEAVMVGASGSRAIAFSRTGVVTTPAP